MDKKQIVFIINPKSGTSNKDVIPSLIEKHIDSSIYDVKCIFTEYAGHASEIASQCVTDGVFIEKGIKSQPAVLEIKENTPEKISVYLTIHEGRFHQVKKMFEAVGRQVIYLKRVAFGPLTLDETLKEGEYRMLTCKEIESLQNAWQHQTNTNQKKPPEVL